MKHKIACLLAVVLLLSFGGTALAAGYSDLATQSQVVQDAVYKLSALQIVNGYEDGTWRPEGNISRAEFAKVACLAGGYGNSYQSLNSTASSFPDVKTNLWYTGWVNLAQGAGYMQGDANGYFRPDATITENEVITVLLRLLGYNDQLAGGWPINYLRQAGSLQLLDDITFTGTVPARRATVAVLVSRLLEKQMVVWQKDSGSFFPANATKNTLLDVSFAAQIQTVELEKPVSGQDPVTAGWRYADFASDNVQLVFENAPAMGLAPEFQLAGGHTLYDLAGHYGTAIYTTKEEQKQLLYLDLKSTSFYAQECKSTNGKLLIDNKSYAIAANPRDTDGLISQALSGTEWENAAFLVYLNADGAVYDILENAHWGSNVGVLHKINVTGNRLTYVDTATVGNVVSNFKDKNVVVFKNNNVTKGLAALVAGDVVTTISCNGANEVDYALLVLEKKSGMPLAKIKDHTFTFGKAATALPETPAGTKPNENATPSANLFSYQADEHMLYTKNRTTYESLTGESTLPNLLRDQVGASPTYVLGRNGKIVLMEMGTSQIGSKLYGVLLDYTLSDAVMGVQKGAVVKMKVFTSQGRTATYEVADAAYVSEEISHPENPWQAIEAYQTAESSLMYFQVAPDGKTITKALEVNVSGEGSRWPVDKEYRTFDGKELAPDCAVFQVKLAEDGVGVKSASKLSADTVLYSSQTSAKYGCYVTDGNDELQTILFVEFGGVNYYQYGVIGDIGFTDQDVKYGILLAGDNNSKYDIRNVAAVQQMDLGSGDLISFRIIGGDLQVEELLLDRSLKFPAGISDNLQSYSAELEGVTASRLKVKQGSGSGEYTYNNNTKILDYRDFERPSTMTAADLKALDKTAIVVALLPDFVNNKYDDLLAIVVLEKQNGISYPFDGFGK